MKSSTKPSYEVLEKLYSSIKENHKNQTNKLNQTKEFLDKIEKTAKIGYWEFYPKTLKQTWSDEIFRILEYDMSKGAPDVPQGMEFIDENFREEASQAVQRAMLHGKPYEQEWIVNTKKGKKKWVRALGEAEIVNGEVVKIFGSFQDITLEKTTKVITE